MAANCPPASRPYAVWFGKFRVDPDDVALRNRLQVLARHFNAVCVVPVTGGVTEIEGVRLIAPRSPGLLYYPAGAALAVRLAHRAPGSAIVCQRPIEGALVCLAAMVRPRGLPPRVVVEVHGDWATAGRLYGSPARRLLAGVVDRLSRWAVTRADRVRTIGAHTDVLVDELVRSDASRDRYPTFSPLDMFVGPPVVPLPSTPTLAFIGGLEPVKGPDLLLKAWADVQQQVPGARLRIAGVGPLEQKLRAQVARDELRNVVFLGGLDPMGVRELLDQATALVVPSRSEGLGRVIIEAMARGRAVVGHDLGGIAEQVDHNVTGLLADPASVSDLASAMVAVLRDHERAKRLGATGRANVVASEVAGHHDAGTARLAAWIAAKRDDATA